MSEGRGQWSEEAGPCGRVSHSLCKQFQGCCWLPGTQKSLPAPTHLVRSEPTQGRIRKELDTQNLYFFSPQIFAERECGMRTGNAVLIAHTTLKFRLAGAISPA